MSYDIQEIFDEIQEFTPDSGYNLVGIDSYERPGEKLYLIAHFDTIEEAKKAQEKYGSNSAIYYKK